ncbi:hypothetical protein JCM8547_002529 [Rhodosporidiobolus lusitaniae]
MYAPSTSICARSCPAHSPLLSRRQRAPPSDAPPPYGLPARVTRSNLRPAVLCTTFFGTVWGIIAGASFIKNRRDDELPDKLNTVYLALGILYFVCAALEAFGFFAAWKSSIALIRSYFWASAGVAIIVIAAEVTRTTMHFVDKSDIKKACNDSYADDISKGILTAGTVSDYCDDRWRNATYVDIALLLLSLFVSFFFASLAASYLHQLQNPQLLRTHAATTHPTNGAGSSAYAYPLQAVDYSQQPPYPHVSPYGAAPPPPPQYGYGQPAPGYDNPHGYAQGVSDQKSPVSSPFNPPVAAGNPFADSVEHGTKEEEEELVRRSGETAEEFERRQHERDLELERRRAGESTETVTLGGRGAEGRV